eukprot:GHVU01131423.1.p2 GENE.GHVU01131423.1~~GHVU01131423.1.p2  ORF type:complete len:116 (+),score=7.49 GHVU01131423.1:220-567(+)
MDALGGYAVRTRASEFNVFYVNIVAQLCILARRNVHPDLVEERAQERARPSIPSFRRHTLSVDADPLCSNVDDAVDPLDIVTPPRCMSVTVQPSVGLETVPHAPLREGQPGAAVE